MVSILLRCTINALVTTSLHLEYYSLTRAFGSLKTQRDLGLSLYNYCIKFYHRLSGIIHVLYAALKKNLAVQSANVTLQPDDILDEFSDSDHAGTATDNSTPVCDLTTKPSSVITEEEAQMAVHLFQEQRRVYEQVK